MAGFLLYKIILMCIDNTIRKCIIAGVNTTNATQNTIHASELLVCGCRVCPTTGARFTTCSSHIKTVCESLQAPAKRNGQFPLCPTCASYRIVPVGENAAGTNLVCRDCGELFAASQIISYGTSDRGDPRKCDCGAVHYGQTDMCSLCAQREAF